MIGRLFGRKKDSGDQNEKTLAGLSDVEEQAISPTVVKETVPGDKESDDYYLEIGDNLAGSRKYRTWFAKLTGRTTWMGILEPLIIGNLGEGDVDVTVLQEPMEVDREINRLAYRIAVLQADLFREVNPAKAGAKQQELLELQEQMARLRVNLEKLHRVSIMVTASHNDKEKLKFLGRAINKRMGAQGIVMRAADTRQLEAYRNALGIGDKALFSDTYQQMETTNVADLFVFGYGGLNHRSGVLLGVDNYGRPVFYDGWHPSLENFNMVMFGRSGAGKSFCADTLTRRSALEGIKTAIIDPERQYANLARAMGGPYIELSPKSPNPARINIYDVYVEDERVNLNETMKGIEAVIFKMLRLFDGGRSINSQVVAALEQTIGQLYDNFGITEDPRSLYDLHGKPKPMPTLYDHYLLMREHPELQEVANIVKMFTRESRYKNQAIFDGESTVNMWDAPVTVISIADLDDDVMKPLALFVATKWIWERFVSQNVRQRKRVIVDEAQLLMQHHESAVWLENAFRRARKRNTSMCAITQGFEVFLRVPEGMGVLKNAPTKLLLKQEAIDIDAVKDKFYLSEGEAQFLLTASPGTGILKAGDDSVIVNIIATPQEYQLYTTDPRDFEQMLA
jgi:type IV secretory pathway VirB4 component